jgi:hypothetical protein
LIEAVAVVAGRVPDEPVTITLRHGWIRSRQGMDDVARFAYRSGDGPLAVIERSINPIIADVAGELCGARCRRARWARR